ncbi:MAG: ATP-binding protein [Polyangiaceae bacterium]
MTPTDELIEAIRKRPGMYVGNIPDGSGLQQLIWELVANSLDQHLAGRCSRIDVTLSEQGEIVVADDGPGIPLWDECGQPFAEIALTQAHSSATFDGHRPHEHWGLILRGLGLFPVNVLCERLTLESFRDGYHYRQQFGRGRSLSSPEVLGVASHTGTSVALVPDPVIFGDAWIDAGRIALRLRELACLCPGLRLSLNDRRAQVFHEPRGLVALLERMRRGIRPISPTVVMDETVGDVRVEAALEWLPVPWTCVESYANVARTTDGGTHVDGLLNGVALAFKSSSPGVKAKPRKQVRDLIKRGLSAVVCVRLNTPTYGEPTRSRLATPAVAKAVSLVVRRALPSRLQSEQALVERLLSA